MGGATVPKSRHQQHQSKWMTIIVTNRCMPFQQLRHHQEKVGNITVVDFDNVDVSNFHWQVIHSNDGVSMNKAITACASLRVVALNSIFQFFLNNNYGLRAIKIQRLCCYRYLYYPRVSQPQNSHYKLCMPFEYYSRPSPATKSPTYERIAMTKSSCSDSRIGRFNQCQNRETIGGAATCGQKNLRK